MMAGVKLRIQVTLDDDGGRYEDNTAIAVGGQYLFGDRS